VTHLIGDKAYRSRANRVALRARRIPHTIPERDDQKANRARRGAQGGRPPASDRVRYRTRNQAERLMNRRNHFRAVATRDDIEGQQEQEGNAWWPAGRRVVVAEDGLVFVEKSPKVQVSRHVLGRLHTVVSGNFWQMAVRNSPGMEEAGCWTRPDL
jgi:hypothetical protein